MADLRDVLRSFALKKMQEIKDESKEKDKLRTKEESSSKRKKERKRHKDERDSSYHHHHHHKSKKIALSEESSGHEKHTSSKKTEDCDDKHSAKFKDTDASFKETKSHSEKKYHEEKHEQQMHLSSKSSSSCRVKIIRVDDPRSVLSNSAEKRDTTVPKQTDAEKFSKPQVEPEVVDLTEENEPIEEIVETNFQPKPSSKPLSKPSSSTMINGKSEKKTIRINILTKELKVPTPPPSPPKKPKKELEDGEISESGSGDDTESESDNDSDDSSDNEEKEPDPMDGSGVPWREQGSSEGEASSTTDSDQEGKEIPLGKNSDDKAEKKLKDGKKSKKHKHKHKHKKHKHKKVKEKDRDKMEKTENKILKDSEKKEKSEDSEKKKSKHKKDKKDKKKDKKSKAIKDDEASKAITGETSKENMKDKDKKIDKNSNQKHRSRSRSRSQSGSRSHRKHRRSRSRSQERSRDRSRYRSRSRSRDRLGSSRGIWTRDLRARQRARSRDRDRRRRSRSYTPPEEIDKQKLYEIAKANAYAQLQRGELPANLLSKLPPLTQEDKVAQKAGGKTVAELTEKCMQLASTKANATGEVSDSDASPVNKPVGSDDEPEEPFIRHPFRVKDAPLNIIMNIKNAVPLPVKDKDTLRLQFPVSSGTQHRKKEDDINLDPYGKWQTVQKLAPSLTPAPAKPVLPPTPVAVPILNLFGTNVTGPSQASLALDAASDNSTVVASSGSTTASTSTGSMLAIAAPPPKPTLLEEDKVFQENNMPTMDIGTIVSARLKAARALESNPNDVEALTLMHRSQTEIHNWTVAKQKPGQFTGSTGIKTLRPEELANSNPAKQAWAKKNMFHNQPALRGGIGMHLMQKMGWKQGLGLGISNQGQLEPLALDVKTDRKGLVATDEQHKRKNTLPPMCKDISGKHPVSALMEICNKKKWKPPQFELLQDNGPPHRKQFIFKVIINNKECIPESPSGTKKQAKAHAAAAALEKLGLV